MIYLYIDDFLADNHAIMMYAPFLEEGVLND